MRSSTSSACLSLLSALVLSLFAPLALADNDLGPKANRLGNLTLSVLPNGTDPKAEPTLLPMASLRGKPVAFLYWKVSDSASETELKAFQALSQFPKYKGKIHFYAGVKTPSDAEKAAAIKRAREMGLTLPLILDRDQIAPYLEAFFEFPRYGLVDKEGFLRIWNCANLNERVGGDLTFLKALEIAASGQAIPTFRGIGKLANTHNLVGKPVPNVGLESIDKKDVTVKTYLTEGRPIVLAFWSVTCPHCRQVIPAVGKYWNQRKGNLDMLTITRAPSDELRKQIIDLQKETSTLWPVSYAPENSTLTFFEIVKVPTVILVDGKGIVRHVWIQPDADWIGKAIEAALFKYGIF